jgi:site-specific recombinase XerD
MNGPPSLGQLLQSFFRTRLVHQRNASPATIASYRDAVRLLVLFAAERTGRTPCALAVQDLDRDLVLAYLDHLEHGRENSIRTRNARLTAIRSFFHHVAANDPGSIGIAQRILAIPIKRANTEVTCFLSRAELDALIDAPDQHTPRGRRDHVLLLFLARTGARVSEALHVDVEDLQLERPRPHVLLRGKGRKERTVPLAADLTNALEQLLRERGIARHAPLPLFIGSHGQRLTRFGATHIVTRAATIASQRVPLLSRKRVSPHVLRHSLAMTLLQSHVDLLTIQAWLGHAQVATTHRYASADVEMMRNSLQQAGITDIKEGARFQPKDEVLRLLEGI